MIAGCEVFAIVFGGIFGVVLVMFTLCEAEEGPRRGAFWRAFKMMCGGVVHFLHTCLLVFLPNVEQPPSREELERRIEELERTTAESSPFEMPSR